MNKSIMNIEEVDVSIEKLKMYRREESICLEGIIERFKAMNCNYVTNNGKSLNGVCDMMTSKLKIIDKKYERDISILLNNISSYEKTVKKVENLFDNIS